MIEFIKNNKFEITIAIGLIVLGYYVYTQFNNSKTIEVIKLTGGE